MQGQSRKLVRLLSAGLVLGAWGCSEDGASKRPSEVGPSVPPSSALASLARASSCDDLLTKIQDDAVAKVKMAAERAKTQAGSRKNAGKRDVDLGDEAAEDAPTSSAPVPAPPRSASAPTSRPASDGAGATGAGESSTAGSDPIGASPTVPGGGASNQASADDDASDSSGAGPTGASRTNEQVQGVDEADFVKVVQSGAGMFLLHGDTLQKLKTYPAAQTALTGTALRIEGSPSEMFVSDEGKAVVFSSVYGYESGAVGGGSSKQPVVCRRFGPCGGGTATKITVADVSTDAPKVDRELYYTGSYVSSRRYDAQTSDIVRVIIQSGSEHYGLYEPDIEWNDPWGRAYDQANIASQLLEWETRTSASIRNTKLEDWLPTAYERMSGQLVELSRQCESHYVPAAGLSEYGLTQVLSLDVAQPAGAVGGVTIVGAASTVYSNAARLVLAQPDYRWSDNFGDLGMIEEQRTALHVFELALADTRYLASGWVAGHLPPHNPQFGIDVAADGTVRVATTGQVRDDPSAQPDDEDFWRQHPETRVITARVNGQLLEKLGETANLGLPRETIQSARFVGDRAYVVTFEQTDPLVVVDVSNAAAPTELGQIKIPGFSQYMHPLDANHLITVGQSATRGIQLQLFDVTDPKNIPAPKVLDFGEGSSSEASYQHKAFTLYNGLLAVPVSGSYRSAAGYGYSAALRVVKVDATAGFSPIGNIDHTRLYADNGAGVRCGGKCDANGCYDYGCGYSPEVRRGHFVSADNTTYVYSFSHAGVLVHDLANLALPLATVALPPPVYSGGPGVATSPGSAGGVDVDEVVDDPPSPNRPPIVDEDSGDEDTMPSGGVDAGAGVGADAGVATAASPSGVDAGVPAP